MNCLYYNKNNKSNPIGDELALDRYIYTNRDEFISMLDTVDLTLSTVSNLKDNATQADVVSFIETMHREDENSPRGVSTTAFWDRFDIDSNEVELQSVSDKIKQKWIKENSEDGWTDEIAEKKYKAYQDANPAYDHIGDAISKALEYRLSKNNTKEEVISQLKSWIKNKSKAGKQYLLFKNDVYDNNFYESVYDAVDNLVGYIHSKFGNDCVIKLETGLCTKNVSDGMLAAMKAIRKIQNSTSDVDVLTGRVDITVIKADGTVHTLEMKSKEAADWSSVNSSALRTHKYQVATYDLIRRQRKINTTPYLVLMTRTKEGFVRFNGDPAFLQVGTNEREYLDAQDMVPLEAKLELDNVDAANKVMGEFFESEPGITKSIETLKRTVDYWMDVNNDTIKAVTSEMKTLWDKGHRFYYTEYRNGRRITKSAKTREDLRSDIEKYVNYLNELSSNALMTFAKEFKYVKTIEDLRNLLKRNGYAGDSINTMTNHLWKYINGWTLSDNLALISNGFLLFRKGGRSEIVMFTESKPLKMYHKFSKIGDRTTILGSLYRDNEAGSGNTQILSAQYGNLMLMKAMAIIADNPDVFKTDKISSISAINPKTGEVSNTVSNDKLNVNWKILVHKFKKSNLNLIDNCFLNDVDACVYRARDWVDLTEGAEIANEKGALVTSNTNFSTIAFDSEVTDEAKKQIRSMIRELKSRFGDYSDSMDYRIKRAYAELNKALLSLDGYTISPENDVSAYFDQGFTMTGSLMAPFYRSNSANLREFSRIAQAFHYKLNEEIQKAVTPFQAKLKKVLQENPNYTDAIGGEYEISKNWFVKDENGNIHRDFRVVPPYDPSFEGTQAEAELLDYVLETFAKWRWGNSDYSYRKADPTSDYYKMPLYESGWVESIDTSDNKIQAVVSLGKKKLKRTINVSKDLLYGQDFDLKGFDDPAVLNQDHTPNPLIDDKRDDKLRTYGPDVFTKNIDKIFLFTAATAVKSRLSQEMLPTLTAFRQLIHFMNVENKTELKDIESAIIRYMGTVIFDKAGVDSSLLAVQAVLQVFRQAFSVFTLGLNSKNFVRDITSSNLRTAVSLLNGSDKSMGIKSSEFFTAYNYILKNGDAIFTSSGRLNQLNLLHRMANMSYREIAGQLKTNKFAVKNIDSSFLFITSTGSDFLHRMALLTAYLKKLGAFDAYVENKDGVVEYNMELDDRFKILFKYKFGDEKVPDSDKDAFIKARNLYIESLENWRVSHPELKYGDKLPLALDPKQEASLKSLSNNLYGAYDKEEQALVHSTLLGGAFFQFKTYGISRLIDWWRRPGQISIVESKIMKNDKGEDMWEIMDDEGNVKLVPYSEVQMESILNNKARPFKMEMGAIDEGRLQTLWTIAVMAYKSKDSKEAEEILRQVLSDPMSRENVVRAMLDIIMALLIQGFIRITYPEEVLDNMTEQDWWTRWTHAILTGVAQDGPVWEVFNSVWGGGEIPVVSGMSRWITSAMGVINGDYILPALANTWGATREFSGMLKDL